MEADFIYWWTYLDYFLFLLVSRIGTVGWTKRWVPKCALAITFLANFWFQKFKVVFFPSNFWFQNLKEVVFPSNFWFEKFKVVVFPLIFLFQNFKLVVFPSNFWKTTIIWQFFRVILNFSQECYYLKNKVGVVDFIKARGPLGFKTLPLLGHLQNLLLPLYFWGNVSLP